LFFAVVRFSPPSQETEVAKRKSEAKNIHRIRKSRSLNLLVAADGRSPRPRQVSPCLKSLCQSVSNSMAKKSAFLFVFLLTLFENILKYSHVCQKANISRQ